MRMARANAEQMYAQALAEFPFECCGMIIGPEGEDIEAEDIVIEGNRSFQVGDLQVDMADGGLRVNGRFRGDWCCHR